MVDIYQYTEYRTFLNDYFVEQKKTNSIFSHQYFARKAGIRSSGFVLHVIKGQRNLTRAVTLKIARAMKLTDTQTEYLEDLVSFDQAKTQSDREHYFSIIYAKRKNIKVSPLLDQQYEFYSTWYHCIIRELVTMLEKNNDFQNISKLLVPAITPKQAKSSLNLLVKLGLLKRVKDGSYRQDQPFIAGGGRIRNTMLIRYQREMLQQAMEAWDRFPITDISMHTLTLSISNELFNRIPGEIANFKKRLLEMAANEKNKPERIFHLNINLFPVTKVVSR
jgi:uncharacterized protein (TIGR02147 family)